MFSEAETQNAEKSALLGAAVSHPAQLFVAAPKNRAQAPSRPRNSTQSTKGNTVIFSINVSEKDTLL